MKPAVAPPARSWPWLLAFTAVVVAFFFEHLFLGRSLLPLDLLNQMLLPREPGARIEVQTHYPIDEITQLVPNAMWWRECVRDGDVPLWNRHLLGGNPQQASGTWSALSPFKLGLLLLPVERWWTLSHIFQFWLAGVFLFALLRELGRTPAAAFLGACAWALSSNLLLFHWLYLNVFTWLPLALLGWERGLRCRSVPWGFAGALALALGFTGGNLQFTVFTGFFWGLWALGSFSWSQPGELRRGLIWIGGVGMTAALLSAAQWLPQLEFLRHETHRFGHIEPGAFGLKHALLGPVAAVATFLFPGLAGSPQTFDTLKAIGGNLIDFNGYIGVVPWALFVVGCLRARDPRVRNLLGIFVLVLVFVFFTPAQRFLYHRFLLLAVLAAVIVASAGLDWLFASASKEQQAGAGGSRHGVAGVFSTLAVAAVLLTGGLLAARVYVAGHREALTERLSAQVLEGAATNQFGAFPEWLLGRVPEFLDHLRPGNPEFWIPIGAALLAAVAAGAWAKGRFAPRTFALALVALGVCELSLTLRDRVPRVDQTRHPFYPDLPLLAPLRADTNAFRILRWMPRDRLLFADNLGWAYGFTQLSGYDSMSPGNLPDLPLDQANGFNRLLDLTAVKYVLTDSSVTMPTNRFEFVSRQHTAAVWHNRDALPFVRFVPASRAATDRASALAQISRPDFDPRAEVILEIPTVASAQASHDSALPAVVRLVSRTHHRARVELTTPVPGWITFAETWYPGWRVTVDGQPAPLLRANGVMQAVAVTAGTHVVEFRFAPGTFRAGAAISLATLAGGALVSLWCLRRARCRN